MTARSATVAALVSYLFGYRRYVPLYPPGPVSLTRTSTQKLMESEPLAGMMADAAGYRPEVKVDQDMPAGVPSLVADVTRLNGICKPQVAIEDYLAKVLG